MIIKHCVGAQQSLYNILALFRIIFCASQKVDYSIYRAYFETHHRNDVAIFLFWPTLRVAPSCPGLNRQHHHLWAKYEFRGGTMARVFTYKSINFFCFCLGSWPINMYTCGTYHILAACFSPKCAAVARDCSANTGFEAATGSQGCSRSVWGADGCASGQDTPAQGFTPPPTPLPPY